MKLTPCRMIVLAATLAVALPVGLALAAAPAGAAAGGDARPIEGATALNGNEDLIESSRLLGPVFKMESEGFRLSPPAGSTVMPRRGVDLVTFVVENRSWVGSLTLVTLPKTAMGLQEFVKNNNGELNKMFKAVQTLQEKYEPFANKPSVRLDLSMEGQLGGALDPGVAKQMNAKADANGPRVALYRQQLIVQVDPDENGMSMKFLILTLWTPLKDRADATQTYTAMLKQFELFDPEVLKQRRLEAVKAGKVWLEQQNAEKFRAAMIRQPQLFKIMVNGKDMGYLRFDEMTQEPDPNSGRMIDVSRDKFKGVLNQVNLRSFPGDGSVVYGQYEAFWAYSKAADGGSVPGYGTWTSINKVRSTVPLPPNQVRPGQPTTQEQVGWVQETGVLSQIGKSYQLVVALSGDRAQQLPPGVNKVIPVEMASPLPKILDYSWTRFVNLAKPSEMTFTVFDSGGRKLSLRNLIVTGQKEGVNVDGKVVTGYKCVDELDPGSTTMWVDNTGRILMMRTSDQSVMIPTTEDYLQKKWGARLKDQ